MDTCLQWKFIFTAVYLLLGDDVKLMLSSKQDFSSPSQIDDRGPSTWTLGCSIIRDRSRDILLLVQIKYTRDILDKFGMSDCASVSTHMSAKPSKLVDIQFNAKEMPYSRLT
jgi:hypothetical protein